MTNSSNDKTMFAMGIRRKEKEELRKLFENLGLDLSTAVNLFFKQCLLEDGIPFRPMGTSHEQILNDNK